MVEIVQVDVEENKEVDRFSVTPDEFEEMKDDLHEVWKDGSEIALAKWNKLVLASEWDGV